MAPKTIDLKGTARLEEYRADAGITPGHILQLNSDNEVLVHATEGGYWDGSVAAEDALQGRSIDTAYVAAELVQTLLTKRGDKVYLFLNAGETITIGEQMISTGDGTIMALDNVTSGVTVKQIIGIAESALDLSASGDVDTRLEVRVF